jgi:hypothetical protein
LGRGEDAYASGTAYRDGAPIDADLAFRLSYDYGWAAAWGDLAGALRQVWLIFPLLAVLLLPGWFLLSVIPNTAGEKDGDSSQWLALASGLSLALVPLLMAWTSLLNLPWSRPWILFVLGVMTAVVLWRIPWGKRHHFRIDLYDLALLGIFLGALFVRWIMVRDLASPAWVDSIHHGMLTHLIQDHGGYPANYLPYLDIDGARYHPGFHALLATYLWLSGQDLQTGMLFFGQVLNALSVYAVYLITVTLTHERRAGIIAAAITAFFSPMPAYYASWGRYTELAGLLILPSAFAWVRASTHRTAGRKIPWGSMALAAIAAAGLFLVHYRVIAFFGCLLLAYFAGQAILQAIKYLRTQQILRLHETEVDFKRVAGLIALIAVASLAFLLPWLPSTLSQLIFPKAALWGGSEGALFNGFAWSFLVTAQGTTTLYLAGLGFFLGLARKSLVSLTNLIWVALLFLLSNLNLLGWMRSFINNLSVEIMLFIPISALGGFLIGDGTRLAQRFLPKSWVKFVLGCLAGLAILACGFAGRQLVTILNPITFLARLADRPSLAWIEANIPQDETILVNPFNWGYGIYAGNDGGYWITPVTGRKTIPPPVLYGMDNNLERIRRINRFCQQVIDNAQNASHLHSMLLEQGIRYIYIGARGGILSPRLLQDSGFFQVDYHQGTTWVFQVK